MGSIQLYMRLFNSKVAKQPEPVAIRAAKEEVDSLPILNDAVDITLAEFDPATRDAITAHHLKDYRRRQFNLVLLPEIKVPFVSILEGSEYWDALLHDARAY